MPPGSICAGLRAITMFAVASAARRFGWDTVFERANRPAMALSDMQPVTANYWRERRKVPGEFHYLALGDSTAQGIGASMPGRSYVGQLTDRIEETLGEPIRVTNLAVSGATSLLCVRDQLPRAVEPIRSEPDLVTIEIGANDIAAWDPVAYHRNVVAILDALPSHTIVGEVPCFHLPWNDRKVHEANRILHRVAGARGFRIVPLYEMTRRRGIRGILTEFAADAFHPNDRGYEIWVDAFWPGVQDRITRFVDQRARSDANAEAGKPNTRSKTQA